jgi:nicotinate-nucleotide adenylyltransferase
MKLNDPLRIGLFGGTFDPVHNAHLAVAHAAADRFGLSRVLMVPAAIPPHKPGASAPWEHRFEMLRIATADDPRLEPSDLERGEQTSYSILTIEKVKQACGACAAVYFIIGADAFAEVTTWFRWQELIATTDFVVVSRPGHTYTTPPGARVHELTGLELPASSSEVRRQLSAGIDPPDVPSPVLRYIRAHRLYQLPSTRVANQR